MGRYTYNSGLVQQALGVLDQAEGALDNTNDEIQKGVSIFYNARGSENIDLSFQFIKDFRTTVLDNISAIDKDIRKKVEEIEEFEGKPWIIKLFASIGLGALKIIEGLASFVENIGDGLVSVVGFFGGLFSSDFKACCAEIVAKDHVGDAFYDAYENGILSGLNDASFVSHTSTYANVCKGFGVAAGYIIVGIATGGAGAVASLGISAGVAAVGALGSGMQTGLQQTAFALEQREAELAVQVKNGEITQEEADAKLAEDKLAGYSSGFDAAFKEASKEAIKAGVTTLVIGGVANKLTAGARATTALNSMDEMSNAAGKVAGSMDELSTALANSGDELAGLADDVSNLSKNLDEVSGMVDDMRLSGGTTISQAKDVTKSAKEIAKTAKALKASAKAAGASDDVMNALDDVIKNTDDFLNTTKNARSAIAGAQGTDAVMSEGGKVSKAVSTVGKTLQKTPVLGKAVTKVGGMVDDVLTKVAGNGTVGKVTNAMANAVAKAPGTANLAGVTSGLAAAGTSITPTVADVQMDNAIAEARSLVTPTANLANEMAGSMNDSMPDALTSEAEIQQNYDKIVSEGYKPGSGGQQTGSTPSGTGDSGYNSTPTCPGSGSDSSYTPVTTPDVNIPGYDSTPSYPGSGSDSSYTPVTTPDVNIPDYDSTPSYDPSGSDDSIIGAINPTPSPSPTPSPGNNTPTIDNNIIGEPTGGYSGIGDGGYGSDGTSKSISGDVLESLGSSTGSLSSLTNTNSRTSIPTSSAPILTTDGVEKKSSMIPMMAGLGAAAAAGIGTKVFLDKKEKSKEEEEENIDTEEWEEKDSVDVDYEEAVNEDADYLMPTDEYAFQEN